jgi:type II secretory ATPase GspE/PulE/Tfp pilus assembly ATPase PilB-like protein
MALNLMIAAAPIPGGGYVSIAKIVVALVILLVWSRLMTWADQDAVISHLPRTTINSGNILGLIIGYALFFLMPSFWLGVPLLLAVAAGEGAIYLNMRNKVVGLRDLRRQFDDWLTGFSKKKKEKIAGEITLISKAGKTITAPDETSPDRPTYDAAQLALGEPFKKKADQIDLDGRAEGGTSVKYIVDGVAYAGKPIDAALGAAAISYIKDLSGLDVGERRKPQIGAMKVMVNGEKQDLKVQTAGNTLGEYMRILINPKNRHKFVLEGLGFSESQLAKLKESIKGNRGVVLLSTPKGMGLTSLTYGVLRAHDAFLQHIQTIERDPEEDLEGITQNKLPANAPAAEEYKSVSWVISQEPDSIFINKVENPQSAVELIGFAKSGKRVYVAMRASSTFEALTQWRKLVADDNLAVEALDMVVNGRVLRKLCNNCKVAYAPDAPTLKKLGMNPEKVTQLFQARTEPQRDQKGNPIACPFCQDLRYVGRTGVFEIMTIDETIRQAVIGNKPIEPVFRKQRAKLLQEEALALVETGDTSLQEVKRILRPNAAADAASGGSSSGGSSPPPRPTAPVPPRRPSAPARKN